MSQNAPPRDRWPPEAFRGEAETVAQMLKLKWPVFSRCITCGLCMRVNLSTMIKVKGPDLSLWNLRLPCRREGCPGRVCFEAKPPGAQRLRLEANQPLGAPAWARKGANWL